jgi:hypothetical protein
MATLLVTCLLGVNFANAEVVHAGHTLFSLLNTNLHMLLLGRKLLDEVQLASGCKTAYQGTVGVDVVIVIPALCLLSHYVVVV